MKLFSTLFEEGGSLTQKATRGGVWVIFSFIFGKILNFIQTIILVRLLLPSDFGLMSLASVTIGAMNVFTETGINNTLIHRKHVSSEVLDTAWATNIIRGFVLFSLLFLLSPLIGNFYKNYELINVTRVIAAIFLINGFGNIGIVLFSKELNFKKKASLELITNLLAFVLTILLAFLFRNVWALVLGQIFFAVVTLAVSFSIHPYRPSFNFNFKVSKELFIFGKHIFVSSVLIFIITNGDNALVGKVMGMSALGFYALAYNLTNLPATSITHVISQVSFPAYSKIQDDLERLEKAYIKVLRLTSFLAIPLAGGLFVLAPDFVNIAYGEKWAPMTSSVMVMCFLGLFRSLVATMGPVFLAIGKPYLSNKVISFQLIIMAILIYPLTKCYGIMGTAITCTIVYLFSLVFHYLSIAETMKPLKTKILKTIYKPFIISMGMITFVYLFKRLIFKEIYLPQLVILISISCVFYILSSYLFDKEMVLSIKDIMS